MEAIKHGGTRYLSLTGLNAERAVRCVGNLDIEPQAKFQNHLVEITKKAKAMRVTTKVGTDATFENDPEKPVTNELFADTPGPHFF